MKLVSGKRFARLLEKRDWELQRINGSHHIYTYPGKPEHISLPIHGNRSLNIGMQKYFMKIAGITEDEL